MRSKSVRQSRIHRVLILLIAALASAGCSHRGGPTRVAFESRPTTDTDYRSEYLFSLESSPDQMRTFSVDRSNGSLTQIGHTAMPYSREVTGNVIPGEYPSAIAMNQAGNSVYVTSYGNTNRVTGYAIDPRTGTTREIPGASLPLKLHPAAFAVDPAGRFLYVGTEESDTVGQVEAFRIAPRDGSLAPVAGSPFNVGPCVTDLETDPAGNHLYVAGCAIIGNQGMVPALFAFAIGGEGSLTAISGSPIEMGNVAVAAAPSGLSLDPSGNLLYVTDSSNSNLWTYAIDHASGALAPAANTPMPIGWPASNNMPSAVAIDPVGSFAYVTTQIGTTRGSVEGNAGGIWTLKVGENGTLTNVGSAPALTGDGPSNVIVDRWGKFVFVANRNAGTLSAYRIGKEGALTPIAGSPYTASRPGGLVDIATLGVK
jgi:6-phosphogluconolactonase (cycloisomerase 2 family)